MKKLRLSSISCSFGFLGYSHMTLALYHVIVVVCRNLLVNYEFVVATTLHLLCINWKVFHHTQYVMCACLFLTVSVIWIVIGVM